MIVYYDIKSSNLSVFRKKNSENFDHFSKPIALIFIQNRPR